MFPHSSKNNVSHDSAPTNADAHHYKIYSYIAALGMSDMINQRLKKASEWLNQPSSFLHAHTFAEADQSIHRHQYDLMVTDNESYYKLIEHLPVFKIKIEQDFFSNDDDPLLSAKPLYYRPEKNTLFIREHSSHNSRFLYEILRLVLMPPVIAITSNKTLTTRPLSLHDFRQVRASLHAIFPYIKLCDSTDDHCPQHVAPDYCPPLQCVCTVQANNDTLLVHIKDHPKHAFILAKQKDTIDFLWSINTLLEQQGCLSFYNDYEEIARRYSYAIK